MLNCQDVIQFLVDYVDGNLDEDTDERFQQHVANCSQCSHYLDQYRETIEEVRRAFGDELPEIPEKLVEYTLSFLRQHYGEKRGE